MEIRSPMTSAVITQLVPPSQVEWFLEWQRGISVEAEKFPGYRGTDLYPPRDEENDHWVVVIHFDNETDVQGWLSSGIRRIWLRRLDDRIGHFDLKVLPGGFGPWFLEQLRGPCALVPPPWKMFLAVLLGLYPTVMLLTFFISPHTQSLGLAWGMLIGNTLSVAILQWAVMPALGKILSSWLSAGDNFRKSLSIAGALAIVASLLIMAFFFRVFEN